MALESLEGLLTRALADLYGAERLSRKALPNMVKAAAAPALKQAFERHLGETEAHLVRLTRCFSLLGLPARDASCRGMEGLVAEANEMMDEEGPDPVVDAGLIGVAQRIEHYEIAAYASAIGIAARLGKDEIVRVLRQTQEEEIATDRMLTELATREINDTAVVAGTRITES